MASAYDFYHGVSPARVFLSPARDGPRRAERAANARSGYLPLASGGCARGLMGRGFGLGGLRRARPPKRRVDVAVGRDARAAVCAVALDEASMVRARRARRCGADEQDGRDRGSSHGNLRSASPGRCWVWRGEGASSVYVREHRAARRVARCRFWCRLGGGNRRSPSKWAATGSSGKSANSRRDSRQSPSSPSSPVGLSRR